MELFAIAFSVPGGQLLGQLYALIVAFAAPHFARLGKLLFASSCAITFGLLIEYLLLFLLGANRSRGLFGTAFVSLHFLVFFFGTGDRERSRAVKADVFEKNSSSCWRGIRRSFCLPRSYAVRSYR